jgi:hypothetical protein
VREQCQTRRSRLQNQLKLIALFFLFAALPTAAQVETMHGTTVVMFLSQDEVTVAADSRAVGHVGHYALYSDNYCKIATFSDKILYAEAGVGSASCNFVGNSCRWKLMDVTRELIRKVEAIHANQSARALASAWSVEVSDLFWKEYFLHPKRAAADAPPGVPLAIGHFATVDAEGVIDAASAQLFHDQPLFGPVHIYSRVDDIDLGTAKEWTATVAGSGGDIAIEFLRGTTARALAERSTWPTPTKAVEAHKVMEGRAIRTVRLSIDFFPVKGSEPADVGGPVDAARLTAKGASWIRNEKNCPEH